MRRFDFITRYSRIEKAATDEEVSSIRQERTAFRDSLSDGERDLFRIDFDSYLNWSLERSTHETAFLKEMMASRRMA